MAIDGSNLEAFANGRRLVSSTALSASGTATRCLLGHRSAISTRGAGSFYGYKLMLACCARTGLPLAWRVETARRNESLFVARLLDALRARGYQPETMAADKAYDSNRVHAECMERDCLPVIPLKGEKGPQVVMPIIEGATRFNPRIQRHTQRFRDLYAGRQAVEREYGRLKHDYGLAPLRVRGLERVALHADLTMLARLSLALNRARIAAVPHAA